MRILFHEIKKIFTWRILLLLVIANAVLFFLRIEFHISHFPNGRPSLDSYRIGIEMISKYGNDMDEEDRRDFKKTYEVQVQEANQYLQSNKEFAEAGVGTYEDFLNIDWENKEQAALRDKIMFEEQVDIFWELPERRRLMDFHETKEARVGTYKNGANPRQEARFDEMISAGHYQVYPEVVMENFKEFIFNVAIAILVSVVLIISPVFMKDRSRQLLDLQYTTRKGRELYKTKLAAGLISTLGVITALLIVYFGMYALNNTEMYFNVPIHMFIDSFSWYDPTLLQYMALTVAAIYMLGLVYALLAMSFSSMMPNYIALIGIQVPFVIAMITYGLTYLVTRIINIEVPQWVVPTSYSGMVAVSVLFIIFMWKREKHRDIVV
ncbi:hypothetical protein PAECIP111893_02089 [Paenibacillus plantiphilus]|uniref:ABC transporter permease n=1 Tax=Paenibacillus plantiphilus TaxID=2905650 RepID=A0ABM9C4H1_9BACL|nr:hypothetical protein [Paenibacillus plantiphilus]CAH1203846.1 hypothetical protein PAECIP111893_02089 [Paenibacillus plantiphilus]